VGAPAEVQAMDALTRPMDVDADSGEDLGAGSVEHEPQLLSVPEERTTCSPRPRDAVWWGVLGGGVLLLALLLRPVLPGDGVLSRADGTRPRPPTWPSRSAARSVFTDGACCRQPGPGGWAWALSTTGVRLGSRGALHQPADGDPRPRSKPSGRCRVRCWSSPDSTYVVNCFRDRWYAGWMARGWTTSAKKPVANRDLWEPLVTLVAERGDVAFQWVKGHSGHEMNDFVSNRLGRGRRASHSAES
jgi:ribonuclease HI